MNVQVTQFSEHTLSLGRYTYVELTAGKHSAFVSIKPDGGVKGQIKKICVNDGQAVEYGQPLFIIE